MISYLLKSIAFVIAGAAVFSCSPQNQEIQRPNIIFIMSDDHAYQAIGAYGYGLNETPNIDRLAEEGAIFTRTTVTNSICSPSRAVLLTGKHSFKNGQLDCHLPYNWDQDNFPMLLQVNGYQTALFGKIHLDGIPQGFDFSMVLPGQGSYYNSDFIIGGDTVRIEGYCTDIITEYTLDWMKNKRDPAKPFCVLYHHKAPHRFWLPAERHHQEFTKKTFKEPANLFDDYEERGTAAKTAEMNILKHMSWAADSKLYPKTMKELGIKPNVVRMPDWTSCVPSSSGPQIVSVSYDLLSFNNMMDRMNEKQRAAWDETYGKINEDFKKQYHNMSEQDLMRWRYQRYMQDYLGCIAAVDEGVGQVLDYLDEAELTENTIVIYTSDQGFYLGEHGWFDKRFMYEESFRTPLLMRYPKEIKSRTEINKLVQNLDFAPTFLDYAGIEIPEDMQGESFRKLVSGETGIWRDAVYYTYYSYPSWHLVKSHYGVATDRYKLMHFYYDIDEWEMYDLETDPMEMKNIYDDPSYDDVQKMLHKRLEELRTYYGDSDELNEKCIKVMHDHRAKK